MDEIIVAGEPTLIIRGPLIPRTLLCSSLLHPLLSKSKSHEDFVAFMSESCIAFPKSLDVVLVTAFWPKCVFYKEPEKTIDRPSQIIKPQHLMMVEKELYVKLTKKSCLFGDFLDSLLLHNEDKRKVSGVLNKVRTWIRENKSYAMFLLTEARGMEDFVDQAASLFEIVVKAEVETEQDESLLSFAIMKHPNIEEMDKKIQISFEKGQPKGKGD